MNVWDLTARRAVIETALDALAARHRLQPQIRHVIDQLYTQGLVFEAERVAGLAIWLGKESPADIVMGCGDLCGTFLVAVQHLSHTLQQRTGAQPDDAIGQLFGVRADFVGRLRQIQDQLPRPVPATACDRGMLVRQIVQFVGGRNSSLRTGATTGSPTATGTAWVSAVNAAAEQGAAALLAVSRLLWRIRIWSDWQQIAPSYEVFLTHHVGLGVACGHALYAVGQVFANLGSDRTALRRLELVAGLVTAEVSDGESRTTDR